MALQSDNTQMLEIVAGALGRLEYPHAAPRLRELVDRRNLLPRTRRVVQVALVACGGKNAMKKDPAQMFYDLALKYYYRHESVIPDERYKTANIWYWRNGRLEYKPVPRQIFCDIYAMRNSRLALQHKSGFYPAVSLWLAAFLKREADLPAGAKDPTATAERARFYALASSAGYLQAVLNRAMRDKDSAVALGAIEPLARTAGAKSLVEPITAGGVTPLVQALGYPERQVRLLAALSLARALPEKPFSGSTLVMSVLKEALHLTGQKTAVLVVSDEATRNTLKDAIRGAGFTLIDEPDVDKALTAARKAKGADLLVLADMPRPAEVIRAFRSEGAFANMPVLIVSGTTRSANLAKSEKMVMTVAPDAGDDAIVKAMEQAVKLSGAKSLTPDEAAQWAVKAAEAIRLLALTKNGVYDVNRALDSLLAALEDERPAVRVAAAQALAVMRPAKAQAGIAKLALNAEADVKVRISAYKALSESARLFDSQLTDELAEQIVAVVTGEGSQQEREAAAEALGALNLASEKIDSLILKTAGHD